MDTNCISQPQSANVFELCKKGDIQGLIKLLKLKHTDNKTPEVNIHDNSGVSLLSHAVKNQHYHIVDYLLSNNANPNQCDLYDLNKFPLHHTIKNDSVKIAELLIEYGAIVDSEDSLGYTPLCSAAEDGFIHIIDLLLEYGANIYHRTHHGETPILLASKCSREHTLVSSGAYGIQYKYDSSTLNVIKLLVNSGAFVDDKDNFDLSCIDGPIQYHNFDCFKFLIDSGYDVFYTNKDGINILHLACLYQTPKILEYIINNFVQKKGIFHFLYYSVFNKLNINNQSNDTHNTPLHFAVGYQYQYGMQHLTKDEKNRMIVGIVKLLLDNGADRTIKNKDGLTPIDIVKNENKNKFLLDILE